MSLLEAVLVTVVLAIIVTTVLPELNEMLPKYYKVRGWDDYGVPLPKTLRELEIRV